MLREKDKKKARELVFDISPDNRRNLYGTRKIQETKQNFEKKKFIPDEVSLLYPVAFSWYVHNGQLSF